ncbi:MAG: AAA family ATPase, partial [Gammaproteobacteria bacterium]|nr:AAA family ATPase [Gammaproteobacteria bacterium]
TPDALCRLRVIESRVNLLAKDADLPKLIGSIKAAKLEDLKLVVVDTLNRAMPGGNENASEDMGLMIDAASAIVSAMGCTFVYIHHSGKEEAKGSRGHSSLKAATEFEISIRRHGDIRDIYVEKVRDAEDGYTLAAFTLESVGSSVVVAPTDARPERASRNRLTGAEQAALDALHAVLDDRKRRRDPPVGLLDHGAKQGQLVVTIEDWRQEVYARKGADFSQDAKRKEFQRGRAGLQRKQRVMIHEEFAWLA